MYADYTAYDVRHLWNPFGRRNLPFNWDDLMLLICARSKDESKVLLFEQLRSAEKIIAQGGKVVFYCQGGRHRSPAVSMSLSHLLGVPARHMEWEKELRT